MKTVKQNPLPVTRNHSDIVPDARFIVIGRNPVKILQPVLEATSVEGIKKNSRRSSKVHISLLVDSLVGGKVDGNLIYL